MGTGPSFTPNCDQRISAEFCFVPNGSSDSTSYCRHKVKLVLLSGSNAFVDSQNKGFANSSHCNINLNQEPL